MTGQAQHRERGVALVLVALLLVTLLTFVAIVVDIGNGRQNRRSVQNSVDAAALAAAPVYLPSEGGSEGLAMSEALRYLQLHDLPVPSSALDGEYSYPCTGQGCVVDFSFQAFPRCINVRVRDLRVGTFFAPVVGSDSLLVGAEANACVREGALTAPPDLPAVFAGGTCGSAPETAFQTSGNQNLFEGGIHSNHGAENSGSSNVSDGSSTYVVNPKQNKDDLWDVPGGQVPSRTWPLNPDEVTHQLYSRTGSIGAPAHALGFHYQSGSFDLKGNIPAGIYYATSGEIKLSDTATVVPRTIGGVTKTGATFVTLNKQIELSGNESHLVPYQDDPHRIVMFSAWSEKSGAERCSSMTVKLSGNCNHFDGVIFAPFGTTEFSGEGNGHSAREGACPTHLHDGPGPPEWSGGVVAWAFKWNGNKGILRGGPSGAFVPGDDEQVYIDQ